MLISSVLLSVCGEVSWWNRRTVAGQELAACSMDFNMKFSDEPECYPKQICFVNKMPVIGRQAKKFCLPVIEPETNNNDILKMPLEGTIYVFDDFENHSMFNLVERTANTWILGPTAVVEIAKNPNLEIRTKPTYCTFMYGLVFYINCPGDYPLMGRMVKLIKWMGGKFQREPKYQTTHMITTSSQAKGYTYCRTFNVPVLSPSWVEHCWSNRNVPNYNIIYAMEKFEVKAFAGLKIALKGYNSEEFKSMEHNAKRYGATVVHPDDPKCSHLIFPKDIVKHVNIEDVPLHIVYAVNEDWFRDSIEQNQRIKEDRYLCFSSKGIRQSLWAVLDAEKDKKKSSTFKKAVDNEDKTLLDRAKIESQDSKRKYAFEELLLKENNYIRCLNKLLDIQRAAIDANQVGGPILTQAEARIIFGNLDKLVRLHQELADSFEDIKTNWQNSAITVQRIIDCKDELLKQYVAYTTNYEGSKKLFESCEMKNKRFRKLLEDSVKTMSKEHPKDIFIRPIQRLCSAILQLREINKNTRDDNCDKVVLNEAIRVVSDVLKKINSSQERVEKLKNIFDIHRLIKNCPPDLITSHREFIVQFSAQEVLSKQNFGVHMMFFLFSDILEITKVRTKGQGALKNHLASDCHKEKLYKHVATIPLSIISNVMEFEGKDEDDQNMFGLNVKDVKQDGTRSLYCFQYSENNPQPLHDVIYQIGERLAQEDSSRSPDDFILSAVPTTRISVAPILAQPQRNAFDKMYEYLWKATSSNYGVNLDVPKTCNVLRKSLSCGDIISAKNTL